MAAKELKTRKRKNPDSDGNMKKKKRNQNVKANDKKRRRGPRLPNALEKELSMLNTNVNSDSDEDVQLDSEDNEDDLMKNDVYEYEEDIPQEESKKNRRFDPVENYEYELPEKFKDSDISEDEGEDDEDDNLDEGRHGRMLEDITGLPIDAFGGKRKRDVLSEAYLQSDGDGRISIEDLLDPLNGKSGISKLRKDYHRMKKKSVPTLVPLPVADLERLERKTAYEHTKKDITKWEPLVKRNREAPTLYFDEDMDLGFSTIGAIASEFEPRTEFEKKMASLLNQNELVEAQKKDGARLLEMNKISPEDFKDRVNQSAKMRSILFHHEVRAKRLKHIKSKIYHRLLKKERNKSVEAAIQTDPEAAKELAMKQEFKRAEERMTLRHRFNSNWNKRIKHRGLEVQDEATRQALGEQLRQHAALTRKMNSLKESSSDDSSDESDTDDASAGSDDDISSKLLMKAKEKTLKALEGEEELPTSGVLSLPFMKRGLRKTKEAADEEARLALEEYESSLGQIEGKDGLGSDEAVPSTGRRVFGVPQKAVPEPRNKVKIDNFYEDSDSDDDEAKEDSATEDNQSGNSLREVDIDHNLLREAFQIDHDPVLKSFKDVEDPEPKATYEVAFLASDSWRKVKSSSDSIKHSSGRKIVPESAVNVGDDNQIAEQEDYDSGSDIDEDMVDEILSSGAKKSYELPSQAELIERAFAGDDVQEDFEKDKDAVLDEEIPQPEKPTLIPGWGEWTDVQTKKGLPFWMLQEHDMAKKKRAEALKKRKDAHLDHVIISEKLDKKAEKLHTKTLPYPYTSQEVFEQSIRMPIGPEFNPSSTVGALNRPEVVKRSGIIIKPIQYEDMNVSAKVESRKHNPHQKQKKGKTKNKSIKKRS